MKTTISILVFVMLCTFVNARQKYGLYHFKGVPEQSETVGMIDIDGYSFTLRSSPHGTFVIGTTKKGKQYPIWMGQATQDKYGHKTVYRYSNGTRCFYKIGKQGYPVPEWLRYYKLHDHGRKSK